MGGRYTRRSVLSAACAITVSAVASRGTTLARASESEGPALFGSPWPTFGADSRNTAVVARRPSVVDLDLEWAVDTDSRATAAVVGDESLYVGTDAGSVLALDPLSGEQLWTTDVEGTIVDAPAFVDDRVLVLTEDSRFGRGELIALSSSDGSTLWSTSLTSTGKTGPAVEDGVVYVVDSEGAYAFDVSDGDQRWFEGVSGDRIGQMAVADGTVFLTQGVADLFDAVIAIEQGSRRWSQSFEAGLRTGPVVGDSGVFIGVDDGTFRALSRDDGEIEWEVPIEARQEMRPALDAIALYVPTRGGRLAAVDIDGSEVWETDVGGVQSSLAVTSGRARFVDDDGRLVSVDTGDGRVIERLQTSTDDPRRVTGTSVSMVVSGRDGIAGFVASPAVEAADRIRELRSVAAETDAVDVSDAIDSAVSAFQEGDADGALDIATAALERVADLREARADASSSVEALESALQRNQDVVAPQAVEALETAQARLEAGDYEMAERTADEGLERLATRREQAEAARREIETLETRIESVEADDLVTDADAELTRARDAFDDGEYQRARTLALEGQAAVETTVDEAQEARRRIEAGERMHDRQVGVFDVGEEVTDIPADELDRARQAYAAGEYRRAAELADSSVEATRRSMYLVDGAVAAAAVSLGALVRAGRSRIR